MKKKLIIIIAIIALIIVIFFYKDKLIRKKNQLRAKILALQKKSADLLSKAKVEGLEKIYELERKRIAKEVNELIKELEKIEEREKLVDNDFDNAKENIKNSNSAKEMFDFLKKIW